MNLTAVNGGTVTLYAQWSLDTYTITYKNANGSAITNWAAGVELTESYNVTDSTITLPGEDAFIAPTAKVFGGWFTDAECTGEAVTKIEAGSTGNKTFYVQWLEEKDEFIFVNENSVLTSVPGNMEYKPGAASTLEDGVCASSDNVFLYWYCLDGTTEKPMTGENVPSDLKGRVELYPKVISTTIKTADDLKALATRYGYKKLEGSYTFTLGATITLSGWSTPIGTGLLPFDQIFDGQNKTTEYTIVMDGISQPLFGHVEGTDSKVMNLSIALEEVTAQPYESSNGVRWGAVAAYNSGTIEGCKVCGTVRQNAGKTSCDLGGIAGYNWANGKVINCQAGFDESNKLTIGLGGRSKMATSVGGLVGENAGTVMLGSGLTQNIRLSGCFSYAGGLIGFSQRDYKKITIDGNNITSTVKNIGSTATGCTASGGLIGYVGGAQTVTIQNCTINASIPYKDGGAPIEGGLIGNFKGKKLEVTGNTITAAVDGMLIISGAGGLVGRADDAYTESITVRDNPEITVTLNLVNDSNNQKYYSGGLIGYAFGKHHVITVSGNPKIKVSITQKASRTVYCSGGLIGLAGDTKTLTISNNQCDVTIQHNGGEGTSQDIGGMVGKDSAAVTDIQSNTLACTINVPDMAGASVGGVMGYLSAGTVTCTGNALKGNGITVKEGNTTTGTLLGDVFYDGLSGSVEPKWNDIALYKVQAPLSIDKSGWTVGSSFKQPASVIGDTHAPTT